MLSEGFLWISWMVAFVGIVAIVCLDVIGSKLFQKPVPGSYEIVAYSQLIVISLAIAATLLKGQHIEVEFLVLKLPQRAQDIINSFICLFGLGLFGLVVWQGFVYGHSLQVAGEISGTIKIPLAPFGYVLGLSGIPVCLIYLFRFANSISKALKK